MKKSFFIGLLLVSVVLGFAGCKQLTGGDVKKEPVTPYKYKYFVANTEVGYSMYFTAAYRDGKNPEKVVLNKLVVENKVYEINKDCTWGENEGSFSGCVSGKTVKNIKWENGRVWNVGCYEKNKKIKIGKDTLRDVNFGWCTCDIDSNAERLFVIDISTYLEAGKGGIGGESYITTLRELTEKRVIATAQDESSLSIDFSEIWEGDKFSGRIIMNKITYGGKVFTLNKDCRFKKSNTTFNDIKSGDTILHKYDWTNTEKFVWGVDCSDINYQLPNGRFVTYVEFGSCTCSCIEGKHFVINIITKASKEDSNYNGMAYFTTLERVK